MNIHVIGICAWVAAAIALTGCSGDDVPNAKVLETYTKGKEAYAKKDLETAAQRFEQVLDEQERFVNARVMLGKVRFFQGKIELANKLFDAAVTQVPQHIEALYYLSRIQLSKNDRKGAISNLEKILEIDPVNARAHYTLGAIYAEMKNSQKALYHFTRALDEESMMARVRLEYARTLHKSGLTERARKILEPVVQMPVHEGLKSEISTLMKEMK